MDIVLKYEIVMVSEYTCLGLPFDGKDSGKKKRDRIFKANRWWSRLGVIS